MKTIVITGSEGKIGKVLKNHFYKNNYDVVGLDLKKGLRTYKCNIVKENDVKKILKQSSEMNAKIITTEKDFHRLQNYKINDIKIIKSELQIMDEEKLINTILKKNETN